MNLAADILKDRDTVSESNEAEARSYGERPKAKTQNTVVPLDEARRRVVSKNFGEITRRKMADKDCVELLAGGQVIGQATAVYTTKTQRTWTLEIGDVILEGQHTISKALRAFDALPKTAEVSKPWGTFDKATGNLADTFASRRKAYAAKTTSQKVAKVAANG